MNLEEVDVVGANTVIEASQSRSVRETYTQVVGKRRRVVDHYNEVVVSFREKAAPRRESLWKVVALRL